MEREGCYYVSLGVEAHELGRLYTYGISVHIIEIFYNYHLKDQFAKFGNIAILGKYVKLEISMF